MRGRLIFPFVVVFARLDPSSIESSGPGGIDGFDDDFHEPILEDAAGTSIPVRRELPEIKLRAQIEPGAFAEMRRLLQGFAPKAETTFSLHMPELEDMGLVGPDGWPTLRPGDRIVRIEDRDGGTVVEAHDPPGLYLDQLELDSFGLIGSKRPNLLICSIKDRPQGGEADQP